MPVKGPTAISSLQPEFKWAVSDRNEGTSFIKFVRQLCRWAIDPKKTVLVMDNMSYHRSKELKKLCSDKSTGILFTPPSSSDLNPVGKSPLSATITIELWCTTRCFQHNGV